jgi:hypothetical protein
MNTAACLVSEVDVLPMESVVGSEPEKPVGNSPLPDVSLKVPSDRDLQIYETAVFAGRSQREVAKEFGISQPRVNQILKELAAWMADNTPNFCSGLTPEQKLRLVHYNVVQQLEYQRCSLMQAWEESRHGTEIVSRTTIVNGVRRTTAINRPSRANTRYMDAAARIALSVAKLSGWTPTVAVTEAPQNSPWWQVEEESGESRQTAVGSGQEVDESKVTLSPWEERAKNPNLSRAEMDAITAEQEAVCAALQTQIEDLKSKVQQPENPLSLRTGPLLTEEGNGSKRTSKQDKKQVQRREFLRGEPPRMTIREYIGPESFPGK